MRSGVPFATTSPIRANCAMMRPGIGAAKLLSACCAELDALKRIMTPYAITLQLAPDLQLSRDLFDDLQPRRLIGKLQLERVACERAQRRTTLIRPDTQPRAGRAIFDLDLDLASRQVGLCRTSPRGCGSGRRSTHRRPKLETQRTHQGIR